MIDNSRVFKRKQKARIGVVESINVNIPSVLQLGILAYYWCCTVVEF